MEDVVNAITEVDYRYYLRNTQQFFVTYWKIITAILWPLFLLPFVLAYNYAEVRCGFVVLVMAAYWILESFPMAVTALLPVVFFPAMGILDSGETCACYMNDTIMVFIGGLVLAIAVEHSNLHLRIALGVMRTTGCSHAKLLGGLCVVTTFVSMWVSNTAATAMMVPIIFAVLSELEKAGYGVVFEHIPDPHDPSLPPLEHPSTLTKAYLYAAAFCATFGGTGTLVGTGTNLTFKGIYENTFPESGGMNFTDWLLASFPQMVVNSFLTWIYVLVGFLGYFRPKSKAAQLARIDPEGEAIVGQVIRDRYSGLGPMTFHEMAVAGIFLMCISLWVFRKPGFVLGWSEVVSSLDLRDSVPVILASILMFFLPKDPSFLRACDPDPDKRPNRPSEGLITWKVIESKMPWSLMFLLGGGFAISKGTTASGLAKMIGHSLVTLRNLPPFLILVCVSFIVGFITEFTSNVGIANITLPIVAQMCVAMEMHPLYLMVPATLMCSYSFRLPVGTPPNAIITVQGKIPTNSLIIAGCIPSIYSLIVMTIFFPTWGVYMFGVREFPEWAAPKP